MHPTKSKFPRLYVPDFLNQGREVVLSTTQAHYVLHVMRKKQGEGVLLFNGKEGEWEGELTVCSPKRTVVVCKQLRRPQKPESDIWLLFAPLKKDPSEFLMEKATELGVSEAYPVVTEYAETKSFSLAKAEAHTIEAAEQCERLTVPKIHPLQPLKDVLVAWPEDRILYVCVERAEVPPLLQALDLSKKVAFLVGPEGGLSEKDLALLEGQAFVRFVSLGPLILRAETAGVVALSSILLS